MVEHAPIGIVIIDRELKWRFVNDRFCEICGYSRSELAGKTFLDITHPDDIDRNLGLYNRLLSGEIADYTYEKRYVRKDGSVIWVRLAVSAVHVDHQYSHMVVSVENIDAAKRIQHMLEVRNEELDTLLYKSSHDLKAPVTTLEGLCHLLEVEHPELSGSPAFHHLQQTVHRLKKQNESLLELTRISESEPVRQSFSLATLVEETIAGIRGLSRSQVRLEAVDVTVTSDRMLLEVALRRVLENSVTHSQVPANIQVTVSHQWVQGRSRITVSDTGPGIPQSELANILAMFYRASIHSHGSGLGLYIAAKAMEKLQGEIQAESAEGKGATFHLLLPA